MSFMLAPTEPDAERAYYEGIATYDRPALLRLCRAVGLTAHALPTPALPPLLWRKVGRLRWRERKPMNPAR